MTKEFEASKQGFIIFALKNVVHLFCDMVHQLLDLTVTVTFIVSKPTLLAVAQKKKKKVLDPGLQKHTLIHSGRWTCLESWSLASKPLLLNLDM